MASYDRTLRHEFNVLMFPLTENIKNLLRHASQYEALFRFWIGTKLYVVTSDPADLEVILNHPSCIDKDDSYRFFEESFGSAGLFTIKSK